MPQGAPRWRLVYKEKAWEPYRLLVPLIEALVLPIVAERANLQKPHAEYDYSATIDARAPAVAGINISTRHLLFATFLATIEFTRFLWLKSRDKSNELIVLVISAISVIDIAVIFLLLTRFSQKVHLLYPWLWTVGRGKMSRSVNGDFQIIIPRIIFAQIIIVWQK